MLAFRPLFNGRIISRARFVSGRRFASNQANVLDVLSARGLVHDKTNGLSPELLAKPSTVYLGVDPSADSLHVGNLLALVTLLHFHIRGHQVIALIGGGTGMIGDPSGKDRERRLLKDDELQENVNSITTQLQQFLERGAAYALKKSGVEQDLLPPKIVNNNQWLGKMTMIAFLRDVGKHARVNQMIARESVKARLESESGISFTEFTYQLLQAYDFFILHRDHGCTIQIGGSDQWGNIVAGTTLIRHRNATKPDTPEAHGLTIPLLTTSSGKKFGKSEKNAIWLKDSKTTVYDFYQFFLRVDDTEVGRYLRMLTFLPEEEIAQLMEWQEKSPELRVAQKRLAEELTEMVHGSEALARAQIMTRVLYNTNIEELEPEQILEAFEGDPRLVKCIWQDVWRKELCRFIAAHEMYPTYAAARRTQQCGGIYLNNETVTDSKYKLNRRDFIKGRFAIVRGGSKKHLVIVTDEPPKNHPAWTESE